MEVTNNGTLHSSDKKSVADILLTVISWVMHPVLVIVWVAGYLLFLHPHVFLGLDASQKNLVLLRVIATSVFLPLMTVLLLKGLGFIDSIRLATQRERIIPYVASITFFFWSYYVSKKLGDPFELRAFLLALFLTASVALLLNNYFKISMHGLGLGGANALLICMLFAGNMQDGFVMAVAFLLTGLTATARIKSNSHHPFEVYAGFITSFVIQVFSWWFLS
jgi:nitrate reductase NapE component